MLDAKPTQEVNWEGVTSALQGGRAVLLHLDYLETTRHFVLLAYHTMQTTVLQQVQEIAGEAVKVYATDRDLIPNMLEHGLAMGRVTHQDLALAPHFIEASLQLTIWAGLVPLVVLAEVDADKIHALRERGVEPTESATLSVKDIVHRKMSEVRIEEISARVTVPTKWGDFDMIAFTDSYGVSHTAVIYGDISGDEPVLMRVHSECFTGDIFGSGRCDCGEQLDYGMNRVKEEGRGVVLYLRQEGRGIGLVAKLNAYMLQDAGYDTVEANHHLGFPGDARDYTFTLQMMRHLGIEKIRLMTNNPRKWEGLGEHGVQVTERVPVHIEPGSHNHRYLVTKNNKLGHHLDHVQQGR
jgi:3,4-dihydroxy 2-butanone 4-phosphate synthase / GTP cyclohydrolase II